MAFMGYGGLERREREKDEAKLPLPHKKQLMQSGTVEGKFNMVTALV